MEDDIDIYSDLDNIKEEEPKIDPELIKELKDKNSELETKLEELTKEFAKLRKYCDSLETNISSLHKTARVEIERKDRMISDLRQQVDNAAFRRDNFRIPKRINKPVKFPPPPKEDSYYPETVKKEVNNTINREETTYTSPLNDEPEDTEQIYQPDKVPVTLFGERLKARLQKEAEEEAEASKLSSEQNLPPESKKPEDLDKENQYRLIPLTLKTSEDSRKRPSENSEHESKPQEPNPRRERETSSNHKKRKLDENQSKREKSPNHRHKSPRRSEERRRLEHEEYCCPPKSSNDRQSTRSRTNGSSRSRSRERREFRSERRKEIRTSRSPNRRSGAGKFGKNDRKLEERGNLRSSKRLRGRDVSPLDRMDLRKRLGRRSGSVVQRRVNGRKEPRNSRSDRHERMEDVKSKEDRMTRRGAERSVDRERRKRSQSSDKRSEKERKNEDQRIENVRENTMDALDFLEEGEIADSPEALIFIPNYHHDDEPGKTNHVESSIDKVGKNALNDNLDDSIKEEKIENIEKFIIKMQKDEENGTVNGEVDEKVEAVDEQKTIMVNNEPVAYNSVLSKYVKKKRDSTEKIMDTVEIGENLVNDSVDKINDCTLKNEASEIANNNVTKNNINTGNKIDNDDSEVKTEIISAPEIFDKISDQVKSDLKNSEEVLAELSSGNPSKVDDKNDKLEMKDDVLHVEEVKSEKIQKSPRKEVPESLKNHQKSETLQCSRVILQQIASPTKTQPKPVDNPQKLEPKEKENSVKISTAQPNRIIVVARRRKVKLTDSSTSMTVVMSAKNSTLKNQ